MNPNAVRVYLPVSIRGDRIGVLQLVLPSAPQADGLDQLGRLATVIGYALQAAARQSDMMQSTARSQRLTLAAELQWQLLPGRGCQAPEYQLAGHLEPAYHVHADNFDWSQDGDQLMMSVTDVARHGRGGRTQYRSTRDDVSLGLSWGRRIWFDCRVSCGVGVGLISPRKIRP